MAKKQVILGDNESLDIIYGDYRFSIEISKIEEYQLPEFDMMLYKGEESVEMAVNCWGENLAGMFPTIAKPVSDDLQHVRLSHQICIPFGKIKEYSSGKRVIVCDGNDCDSGDDKYIGEQGVIVKNNDDGYCEVKLDNYGQETLLFGEYQLNLIPDKQ